MKKAVYIILGVIFLILLGIVGKYLVESNQSKTESFLTKNAKVQDLEDKVLATGKIVPKQEIEIKPNISGIIEAIHVNVGEKVSVGQLIATIKVVPNVSDINNAQQEIKNAQLQIENALINVNNQQKQFAMQRQLFGQGVISKQEFYNSEQQYKSAQQSHLIAKQQLNQAQKRLQIVRTGATPELQGLATTQIRAKSAGTVLDIPVKVGFQVIEANSFNAGTSICSVADLNDLIFEGTIDEAQAGRLTEGMTMKVVIGALQNKSYQGVLTMIAPKAKDENGTIKFPLKGRVDNPNGDYIRAGFSANGEIILTSKKNVLMLDESLVQYDKKANNEIAFVEVKQTDGSFKKVNLKLGGRDGVNVEVLSGISSKDELKVWNPSDKDKEELDEKNKGK